MRIRQYLRKAHVYFRLRPAVPVAAALVAGILLGAHAPFAPRLWIVLVAGLGSVAALWRRRAIFSGISLTLGVIFLGLAVAQLQQFGFPPNDISQFADDEPTLARLELRIITLPQIVAAHSRYHAPPKQLAIASVQRMLTIDGWKPSGGKIELIVNGPQPALAIGQRIRVLGKLARPLPALNPGQFDWAAYDRQQRLLATINVTRPANIEILQNGRGLFREDPLEWVRQKAANLLGAGFSSVDETDGALLATLMFGDHNPQLRGVEDEFRHSGAAHILSTSGLHLAILAGVIYLLCRLMRLRPRKTAWLMIAFVALYGFATLPSTAAIRSVLIFLAIVIAPLMRRGVDRLNLLCLCAIGMLLCQPSQIYSAGFQLTFLTVLGILLLLKPAMALCPPALSEDERVAQSFGRFSARRRTLLFARRRLIELLILAMLAWFIVAPLVAWHFQQLNPYAIAAGLLLLPLLIAVLVMGLAKVLLTLLLPWYSSTWASAAALPVRWLRQSVHLLDRIPGHDVPLAPRTWLAITWYLVLVIVLLALWHHRRWITSYRQSHPDLPPNDKSLPIAQRLALRFHRPVTAGLLGILLLMPVLVGLSPRGGGTGEVRITLLAIGAGQTCVIELPHKVILIDDGSDTFSDPLDTCLAPFLRYRGESRVDAIFLSHPDYDHISACAATAQEYGPCTVYINPVFRDQIEHNWPATSMLRYLDATHQTPLVTSSGSHVALDSECSIDVLWPPAGRDFSSTNNAGLVLRFVCRGHRILFPADIQNPTEIELMQAAAKDPDLLRADVLVAPHHGSGETTTADFVKAIDPKFVLSSNGEPLTHKQQIFEHEIGSRPLYRTNRCGAVWVDIEKDGRLRIGTFLNRPPTVGNGD